MVPLPRSRKARALLVYLLVTGKVQRRDHLCSLFWDVADDPRAALRWCLTQLRQVFKSPGRPRIRADRDTVTIDLRGISVDLLEVKSALNKDVQSCTMEELKKLLGAFRGAFAEGLDLPEFREFEAWKVTEQDESRNIHRKILWELAHRYSHEPETAVSYAKALVELDPDDVKARAALTSFLAESRTTVEMKHAHFASHSIAQEIRFCKAPDGVRIAYASAGTGEPILKASNWLSHLESDWTSPVWQPLLEALARNYHVIRYDQRGNGLSDWKVDDISFDAFLGDLEAVADAAGLKRFALLGISQGCALSIAFAARHPERVSRLILHGGYAKGALRRAPEEIEQREALARLTERGWGRDNPAFRQVFTSLLIPDASELQRHSFNELQRITATPENALRFLEATGRIDVTHLLPGVISPTLVLHSRHDAMVPFEEGRSLASAIPMARFVPLESRNHLILEHEEAWPVFKKSIFEFLAARQVPE